MSGGMQPFGWDLYAQHTDVHGRVSVQVHRVWDSARFLSAQRREAERQNAETKGGAGLASVIQITQQQYREIRGYAQKGAQQ